MSEHDEPWSIDKETDDIVDCNDVSLSDDDWFSKKQKARVVACVNALAGIPNPEAVRELVEAAKEWALILEPDASVIAKINAVERLAKAVESLSAPSTGAQQK